ncbi:MAG: T9SS type A sorting domain-containing protein [Flavobacteriales bacterium]|nr:T9SS type A sorting domain-containing protein [Flavobacteriales bacterium]
MMKIKFILTTLLSLLFFLGKAQEYVPFPDSNAVWSVNTDKFYVSGDTIIGGVEYKKYFRTLEDSTFDIENSYYYAALREDGNKKIWGIRHDSINPLLLYDFQVNIIDTITVFPFEIASRSISYPKDIVVLGKDSILINTTYRKRIKVSLLGDHQENGNFFEYWIEGIGSTIGIFSGGTFNRNLTDDSSYELLCFHENDTQTYSSIYSPSSSCYEPFYVSINDLDTKIQFAKVYPNPSQGHLLIDFGEQQEANVKIFNTSGAEVYQNAFSATGIHRILINNVSGIYFLKIDFPNHSEVFRIIKK